MSDLIARPEPDVTVVVPVYNALPDLTTCLDSLLAQTLIVQPEDAGRMHVVAIDDGSTDGSGEELDRYATAHPGLFTVRHQPNSGGPAKPCNVGLDLATGRYVFFLGADDYLGTEALARMVQHADAWQSDVLCARIIGVGGREWNQWLYAEDAQHVPFPSELLASALSNTKLFRREVIERHGIRYALDMLVGSDQPFTIEALLHASTISVAADYDYYFAVRRDNASNISYTSTWRHRLEAMTAIVEHVAPLLEPGPDRDAILQRHFRVEIATLLREDFPLLAEEEQAELAVAVGEVVERHLSPGMSDRLPVPARVRLELARTGQVERLRALAGLEDERHRVVLIGDDARRVLPDGLGLPAGTDRLLREWPRSWMEDLVDPATVRLDGEALVVEAGTRLDPDSRPAWRLALVRAQDGVNIPFRRIPKNKPPPLVFDLHLGPDGCVRSRVHLPALARPRRIGEWALRVQVELGDNLYSQPVEIADPSAIPPELVVRPSDGPPDVQYVVSLGLDPDGRVLVRSRSEERPPSLMRRLGGRSRKRG